MKALNITALVLIIIGALNWGLVGLFDFNLVAAIFGADTWISNLIYILVALAGVYALSFFAQYHHRREHREHFAGPAHA
ncbi:MAG: hypothetical protein AMXMBFR13_41980 [Phycisphaerae bacterium]|jgi:uncharacterized membrane protein YuzA (DUF378 family)